MMVSCTTLSVAMLAIAVIAWNYYTLWALMLSFRGLTKIILCTLASLKVHSIAAGVNGLHSLVPWDGNCE